MMQDKCSATEKELKEILTKKGKSLSDTKLLKMVACLLESNSLEELVSNLKKDFSSVLLKSIQPDLELLFNDLHREESMQFDLSLYLEEKGIEPDDVDEFKSILKEAIKLKDSEKFESSLEYVSQNEAALLREDLKEFFPIDEQEIAETDRHAAQICNSVVENRAGFDVYDSASQVDTLEPTIVPSRELRPENMDQPNVEHTAALNLESELQFDLDEDKPEFEVELEFDPMAIPEDSSEETSQELAEVLPDESPEELPNKTSDPDLHVQPADPVEAPKPKADAPAPKHKAEALATPKAEAPATNVKAEPATAPKPKTGASATKAKAEPVTTPKADAPAPKHKPEALAIPKAEAPATAKAVPATAPKPKTEAPATKAKADPVSTPKTEAPAPKHKSEAIATPKAEAPPTIAKANPVAAPKPKSGAELKSESQPEPVVAPKPKPEAVVTSKTKAAPVSHEKPAANTALDPSKIKMKKAINTEASSELKDHPSGSTSTHAATEASASVMEEEGMVPAPKKIGAARPSPAPVETGPKFGSKSSKTAKVTEISSADPVPTEDTLAVCIIESFLDCGDGYEIQKSKLHEEKLIELVRKCPETLKACGFYGDLKESLVQASIFLGSPISSTEFKAVEKTSIMLQVILKGNKLAIILQSHPDLYGTAFNRKSPLVEFLRYIIDICNSLLMCIPKGTVIAQGESWLRVTQDSTCTLQATEIKENSKLNLTKYLPTLKDKKFLTYSLVKADSAKLYLAETAIKQTYSPIWFTGTNGHRYVFEDVMKKLAYSLPDQYNKHKFNDLSHLLGVVHRNLQPFLTTEILSDIEKILRVEFATKQEEFVRRESIEMSNSMIGFDSSVSRIEYGPTFHGGRAVESGRTVEEPSSDKSGIMSWFNWGGSNDKQHKPKQDKKGISVSGFKYRMPWEFLIDLLMAKCIKTTTTSHTTLLLSMGKFNALKDFDGSVQKTSIEEDMLKISLQLPSNSEIMIKDFTPLNEDCGFFLIANYPPDKTSLYSYTKSFESQSATNVTVYPSPEHRIIINSNVLFYFIFDNKHLRANIGRLSKAFKLQEGKSIEIFDKSKEKLSYIESATILSCNETVLILDRSGELFSYTHSADKLSKITRLDEKHNPVPIVPEDPTCKYTEVQSSSSGKLIFLLWARGLDIYDGNFCRLSTIPLNSQFVSFKSLLDPKNGLDFILLQMKDGFESHLITGMESSINLDFSRNAQQDKSTKGVRNPIIDYLYLAVDKFGPPMPEISSPEKTLMSYVSGEISADQLEAYMEHLEIPNMKLSEEVKYDKVRPISSNDLKFLLLSRIPIHIASIQNYTLVPLSDGEYQSEKFFRLLQQNQEGKSQINQVCENIRFGHFEEHLKSWKGSISVVSMIGKQSSGKSYMLNRLFGTRFNVAGTRCTDGIWMSMSFLKNNKDEKMLIVVLDCEGLFSIVRSPTEETKLCLALAAVSDVLIINQDLSYNRNLNELMSNLKESSAKLSGAQLFKGCMAFFVRDVVEKSFSDAQQEFESNMKTLCSVPDNFVTKIFQGRVINCLFPYFELKSFDGFVRKAKTTCADQLSKNINRWSSGDDFLFCLKIVLSQLMIDDDISLDDHKAKIRAERFFDQILKVYHQGSNDPQFNPPVVFTKKRAAEIEVSEQTGKEKVDAADESILLDDLLSELSSNDIESAKIPAEPNPEEVSVESEASEDSSESSEVFEEVTMAFKHHEINIEQDQKDPISDLDVGVVPMMEIPEDIEDELPDFIVQFPYQDLITIINKTIGRYKLRNHNRWIEEANYFIKEFFDSRDMLTLEYFETLFKDEAADFKENRKRDLQAHLDKHRKRVVICAKQCRNCQRKCLELAGHANDCTCHTDHLCGNICKMKLECKKAKNQCARAFGHEGSHACKKGHKCPLQCSVEGCKAICQLEPGHAEINHDCKNRHPCHEKCSQVKCTRSCGQDRSTTHSQHECGETKCTIPCQFCDDRCMEENHFHCESIEKKTGFVLDHHNCGKIEHNCPGKCKLNGTCLFRYEPQDKEIINGDGKITYTYMKPVKVIGDCSKTISKGCSSHAEDCKCTAEVHRCDKQCPECGSFCTEKYGHIGNHSTANHRNKEFCKFVAVSKGAKISLVSEGAKRIYNPGETCEPEICSESCKRKFRSHFHLKECPGLDKCPQKVNPRVVHSTEKYHPFTSKVFDKWLCSDYWQSLEWAVPVSPEVAAVNALCNSYCTGCHVDKSKVPPKFCELPALHTGPHKITCDHGALGNGKYQVAFVVDSTGSMGSYIAQAKTTISNLVSKFKGISSKAVLEFAFVDYKDHPPEDTTYVTKIQPFCSESEMLSHISKLSASGGGDYPEAVIDGLDDATNKLSWKSDFNKFIFHIADAPPHGTRYHNSGDGFPGGCPCGKTIESVGKAMNEKLIRYHLMKIGSGLNKMDDIFKSVIKQYQSFPIDKPDDVDLKVTSLLVSDLESAELDVIG